MKQIRKLFPGGKAKAFNISYDDGVTQDIRFVHLLNKYGLKGTFNLNSGLMEEEFQWTHESGLIVKRLSPQAAAGLYEGHEIASHTLTHPYMQDLGETEILHQMTQDKENLERNFHRSVSGFAVPFTYYSDLIAQCARKAGFRYARISEEGNTFQPPTDFYHWRSGKIHWSEDLEEFVESFLHTSRELAVCQIAGHSYDLDVYDMWERMEAVLQKVSQAEDVLPMTHIGIVRYLRAMGQAEVSESSIHNPSTHSLWFRVEGECVRVGPGETLDL